MAFGLGDLKGKSLSDIQKAVGEPNSVSPAADGTKVCQWIFAEYHVTLLFDSDDVCLGAQSEDSI